MTCSDLRDIPGTSTTARAMRISDIIGRRWGGYPSSYKSRSGLGDLANFLGECDTVETYIVIVFTALLGVSSLFGQQNLQLSVCNIMHPEGLLRQRVVVTGRILFTMHGAFLTTDSCLDDSYDVVILYPNVEGTPSVIFNLEANALDQLKPFFRPAGGTATACGILDGQVFYKKGFRSKREGAGPYGNGFGPRGAFRVSFVLHSVMEIRACK